MDQCQCTGDRQCCPTALARNVSSLALIVDVQDESFLCHTSPRVSSPLVVPCPLGQDAQSCSPEGSSDVLVQPSPVLWQWSGCAAWTNTSLDESGGWIATGCLIFLLNRTIFTVCYLPSFWFHLSQSIHWIFLIYSCRKNVRIRLYVFTSVVFSKLCAMKSLSVPPPQ